MTESATLRPSLGGRLTILTKGLILVAIPFLSQIGFIGLVAWMRWQGREAERRSLHTKEVITQTHTVYGTLVEANDAVRGFLLSGNPNFVTDHEDAAQRVTRQLEKLQDKVGDNQSQAAGARQLAVHVDVFLHWLDETQKLADASPRDLAQRNLEGRDKLDSLHREILDFLDDEGRLDVVRRQHLERSWAGLDRALLGGVLVTLLSTGLLAIAFGRGLHRRFSSLAESARRLASGEDLAPPLSGIDEISQVDRVFRDMAEALHVAASKERSYRDQLEERAAELTSANRELQEFASVASHDLQEPLRKIQAFGDRLQIKCGPALDEQGREYLARMQHAAARMSALINDLLTFSRVTTRALPFQRVDLARVAREVVCDLEGRLHQTGGRVELGPLPVLDADLVQMRQLLQNLIGNALKFHKPGEPPLVQVEGDMQPSPSDLSIANGVPSGPICRLIVRDNGIGFDEKYLDRIFNVFQRLHGRAEYEGTGMGLAICRKIVERHHGRITARSSPGNGATFLVTLPVSQPLPAQEKGATPRPGEVPAEPTLSASSGPAGASPSHEPALRGGTQ
jgi:signal transduction histidine kinase